MGLTSLSSALSGLRIYQQQIDVISNNVANVGTEGYTRKILPQSSQIVNGRSIGVLGETIIRNVDTRVQRDLWTQISSTEFNSVQASYLSRIDQFHGAPSDNVSVAAEISKLQDNFSALASEPDNQFLLADVVSQAQDTANKINDLSDYLTTIRNDVQNEASVTVTSINDLLKQISALNSDIRFTKITGGSTAAAEDKRDQAIKELAQYMDITTFRRSDGIVTVQTSQGVEIASDKVTELYFKPAPLSATTSYPASAAGIYVGDPTQNANAINITETNIGGTLGGLIELRDYSFPKQMAQLDELAHKLARRFEEQGLRLFTDVSGSVPADTPPDPTTDPPTPVTYVGFSSQIRVNKYIVNDPSLVQKGTTTTGSALKTGDNSLIRRVIEYTFGNTSYQLASNPDALTSLDIRAGATGGTTLQEWLGLRSTNTVESGVNLSNYASIADIITAGGTETFGNIGSETDTFILRFDDPDIGGGPYDIEINLRSVPVSGSGAAQDLVNYISSDPDWASAVADFDTSVSVGSNGQLVINSRSNIAIVQSPTQPISDTGFAFVGMSVGSKEAEDPFFDISVGNNTATRIYIEPNDTETDLLNKLNAVDGVAAQIDANGFLQIRPGNDFNNPDYGGDITIIGGAFKTQSAALAGTVSGRTSLDDNVDILYALFGTYNTLPSGNIEGISPITDVNNASETYAGSGVFVAFREQYLGPATADNTEINQSLTLQDFGQKLVNETAQELALLQAREEDESSLRDLLNQRLLDASAVNIDEELGLLIVVQTAYAASARVISAVDQTFKDLLNLF